ncbi:serine/threonine protein kinase, partial [candidate division KSB1 bacterium]|nr:serine/threonine protein kinase [candidate division KSB1 bacterium]
MEVAKVLDDKYEMFHEIKRGGFGVIYYGRDRLFDKPVAIKAISPNLIGEAKYIDIFQAESLAIARLNHRNIVRIYDIKRGDGGQFYIIMEFVDGVDLGKLIRISRKERGIVPPHLGAYIIAETCAGLDYAHTRRDPDTHQPLHIVHQDISPGNIMLNRLGEIKIIDFGLASTRQHQQKDFDHKNEVLVQGKLTYLAPEQVNGGQGFDQRVDLFALGLVFYEVLTGQRFFKEQAPEAMIRHLRDGVWDLGLLDEIGTPEPLTKIIEKAVQRDPNRRYQSASQMYMDLMGYLSQYAPAADYAFELSNIVQQISPPNEQAVSNAAEQFVDDGFKNFVDINDGVNAREVTPLESNSDTDFFVDEKEVSGFKDDLDERFVSSEPNATTAPTADFSNDDFQWNRFSAKRDLPEELELTPEPEEPSRSGRAASAPQDVAFYKVIGEEEEEEEVRTIIDVIRLSARSHKKTIFMAAGGILAAFILFTVIDTFTRMTSWGASIYDFLFPPAIRLVSFPPNAQVYLDDRLLPKTTPLAIEKISPG